MGGWLGRVGWRMRALGFMRMLATETAVRVDGGEVVGCGVFFFCCFFFVC